MSSFQRYGNILHPENIFYPLPFIPTRSSKNIKTLRRIRFDE